MLTSVSFIGLDEFTDLSKLYDLSLVSTIPIEIGVLLSNTKAGKENRYPNIKFIENIFKELYAFETSLHICGSAVFDLLDGKEYIQQMADLYGRVQLNFSIKDNDIEEIGTKIIDLGHYHTIIIQHNKSKEKLINYLCKNIVPNTDVDILFDASGGYGKLLDKPKPVIPGFYCGYAGGIAPDTIDQILHSISSVNKYEDLFYIDMESGIRDTNDKFSIEKCMKIIEAVNQFKKRENKNERI